MKKGFTLAELLIVLGITGLMAVVIIPAINNLMPDKTKIMYLKAYDELTNDIKNLAANTSIFPAILQNGTENIDVAKIPLINNSKPIKPPFNENDKYSGKTKLCNLLAFTMNAESNARCSETSYPNVHSYTTPNGMRWWIVETKNEINSSEKKVSYQTDIYVDVDPSKKSGNCMWGESGCGQPDIFKFLLAADGTLIPADPLGRKYIETRKNWLKKKYEVDGEVLANLDDSFLNSKAEEPEEGGKENSGDEGKEVDKDSETPETPDETYTPQDICRATFYNPEIGTKDIVCITGINVALHNDMNINTFGGLKEQGVKALTRPFPTNVGPFVGLISKDTIKISSPGLEIPVVMSNICFSDNHGSTLDSQTRQCYHNAYLYNRNYQTRCYGAKTCNTNAVTQWKEPAGKFVLKMNNGDSYMKTGIENYVEFYNPFKFIPDEFNNYMMDQLHYVEYSFTDKWYEDIKPHYDSKYIFWPYWSNADNSIQEISQWAGVNADKSKFIK